MYVSPEQFRQRMEVLKSFGASVIPLSEGIERLRAHSLPRLSVAITFDDGFYDFYRHAVPILNDFGYPCTLYLTTHYCDYRLPIFDLMVNYILWKSGKVEIELPTMGVPGPMPMRNENEREAIVQVIRKWGANLTTLEKDCAARELAELWHIDYDDLVHSRMLQIMSPEEVTATAKAGIDIDIAPLATESCFSARFATIAIASWT
jgi:hypothetical protein